MEIINTLNDRQREAVLTTEGPVMVMAGAGSGKTKVLTSRIAYLINEKHIGLENILAVTFTNKAAREMKDRIGMMLNIDTSKMWVSTFHSFCNRFLRMEINATGIYNRFFQIIDEDDSIKIIRELIKEHSFDDFKPKEMKDLISKKKNGQSFEIRNYSKNNCFEIISKEYDERLKQDNALDFDDLILVSLNILKTRSDILEKYQNIFEYVLIDEFQDTNTMQYELMEMLARKHRNIFIVGDQDQSIYAFRGAKIENIDRFQRDFSGTKIILLERNYRSTTEILNAANAVIGNNKNRIKKNLYTDKTFEQKPFYYHADSSYDEVMFVVDKIKELKMAGYDYNDFAIIYRTNVLSRNFEDVFIRYQIPYVIYGGLSFFSRKEVKDVIAYIRLAMNVGDDLSFKRIVNEPKRKIGEAVLSKLKDISVENNVSLFEAIDLGTETKSINSNLIQFKEIILNIKSFIENNPLSKLIDFVLTETSYLQMLKDKPEENEERISNVRDLKTVIKEAEEFYEGTNAEIINQILEDIALRSDTDNKYETDDTVKLMSYHQAKGLEYKVVFLVALEQNIFPSINAIGNDEIEEERRVCYVGITRAMEKLYLTNAASRYMYGSQIYAYPSDFISEIGKDNIKDISKNFRKMDEIYKSQKPEFESNKKIIESKEKMIFVTGDKINHKAFGDGIVVSVEGDIISVAFKSPFGIKKLISTHPSIRKME